MSSGYLKQGDCLELMKEIPDQSIDLILCDLPYGMVSCEWDKRLTPEKLWEEYSRIISPTGNIVLFSSGQFTIDLILSNPKWFKYKLIWKKNVPTGMSSAKYRPMKYYEEICIFQPNKGTYNPQMKERVGKHKECYRYDHYCGPNNHLDLEKKKYKYDAEKVQPSDVLEFNVVPNRKGKLHPTQKPVDLLRYLIRTYSNESDIVLDNCMGSGSTIEASILENRNYIGFELDEKFFEIANNRVNDLFSEISYERISPKC